jgi:ABC-type transport system substrate-binding protein
VAGSNTAVLRLDPAVGGPLGAGDESWQYAIYGTLMRLDPTGKLTPWLAKTVTVADPQTIKVVLQPGNKYSDGTPFDAQAEVNGVMRNLQKGDAAAKSSYFYLFPDLQSLTVDSQYGFTIHLSQPVAGEFLQSLGTKEFEAPSPTAITANANLGTSPVGAGPYMVTKFVRGQILSLRKNPNFFQADKFQLAGIDFIDTPAGQITTALKAGTVDFGGVTAVDYPTLIHTPGYSGALLHRIFDYLMLDFCYTKPPFDNVKVRQAIQAAVDRANFNQLAYGGYAPPAYGFNSPGDPFFDPALKKYVKPDLKKAKQLLTQAGVSSLTFDLWNPSVAAPQSTTNMEVLQAQFAKVGITTHLNNAASYLTDFYTPGKPGILLVPGSNAGTGRVAKVLGQGQIQSLCGGSDETSISLINQIAKLPPTSAQVKALWNKLDEHVASQAQIVFLNKVPTFYVWNSSRVGFVNNKGPAFFGDYGGPQFDSMFIKKA